MFIREKKNNSGSISVQIILKSQGRYKVVKTIGSSNCRTEVDKLLVRAREELTDLQSKQRLFDNEEDLLAESIISSLRNSSIRTVGPELVFGKIFDKLGYNTIPDSLFRHLVLARLAFPLSKLKTSEYLYRYQGISITIDRIYRFLDKISDTYKSQVEQITFARTKEILGNHISVVFYDMTTLYFEASDEDDLRKAGFSKDGKHNNPQIFLGLLVGIGGYAIGYDIYEGNIYEGHTLIPFIERIRLKFGIDKPIVVADSGLLSNKNIEGLTAMDYQYIIGAKIKNEQKEIKQQILKTPRIDGKSSEIELSGKRRLVLSYSAKRASKDAHNRKRGLIRLEKKVKSGKLKKADINNKGYNKYLRMSGQIEIEIDYEKFAEDQAWDGIKGYVTNTTLSQKEIIANYNNLWQIEKAFRMSKTDLRIRPIYHRLRRRIEAHMCISFTAYSIYKDLEKALKLENSEISIRKAAELTQNIYQIDIELPHSRRTSSILLKMDEQQEEILDIVRKHF